MPSAEPSVAVVVVSTNDGRWLDACLDAICASATRVIVVLNACTDRSPEICAAHDVETVCSSERLGFAAANNLALATDVVQGCELAFLLNPDTIAHPAVVPTLAAFLREHPVYGVAGAWQIAYDDDTWETPNGWTREVVAEAAGLGHELRPCGDFTVLDHYYVQGAALMVRSGLLRRVGLLDDAFGTFYEETELCRRVALVGSSVGVVREAMVRHAGGGTWRTDPGIHRERDRLMLRNELIFDLTGAPLAAIPATLVATVRRQVGHLRRRDQDLRSGLGAYPGIVLSVLGATGSMRRMRRTYRELRASGAAPG